MLRLVLIGGLVLAGAGFANAQDKKDPPKKKDATPAKKKDAAKKEEAAKKPEEPQMVRTPVWPYGYTQPIEYPFRGYTWGYPYPGYTMVYPYPRTVSSYSFGPTPYPFARGR